MRPQILFPIFASVTSLNGVGPRIAKLIENLAGSNLVDLIWHLPREIVDRRFSPSVGDAPADRLCTLTVTVEKHEKGYQRRPYRVRCSDESGFLTLVFFHAKEDYLLRLLPPGETRIVSGTVEVFNDEKQITHPDYVLKPDDADTMPSVEPVYPLTAGLTLKTLGKAVRGALEKLPNLEEWLDPAFQKQRAWPSWNEAVVAAHAPEGNSDLEPLTKYRTRLAYDELLANQLALALIRRALRKLPGREITGAGNLRQTVLGKLPFQLTEAQEVAIAEITQDMAQSGRMLRLLQGDVGSGKTVVALFAALNAIETGGQAAIMAPTEILARQHYDTLAELLDGTDVKLGILTGRDRGSVRSETLAALADGTLDLIVGTHALFQKDVEFKNLLLAVIDEQHRFGVHQRLTLAAKGRGVDTLVMTATPIPRTLLLTAYGDLDCSRLTGKPPGRQPVDTRTMPNDRLNEVIASVGRAIHTGARVYWVCPLVEESETVDLANAEARFASLKEQYGDQVELIHGRMKAAEKDAAMARFAEGAASVLVATTVIEVGVDVPEATIMVIEHAERFGLAQLHQLRGRVGRGEQKSNCLLVYASPLTETARARLKMMRETDDGFLIAEEDLRLRGGGEILGTRQSGLPAFRLADLAAHADLLPVAQDDAKLILERDPELDSPRGEALRTLLYLFERDEAVAYLRSG
ncbi:MAG: ATP-dependent DNA helicase RecG [Rhodospirillaceae bacterium]|nr:ATP-dependent DNA helicase RecG [Rhodospirillaceae bacterium]